MRSEMTIGGEGLWMEETSGTCWGLKGSSAIPDAYYCHYATAGTEDYNLFMHTVSYWQKGATTGHRLISESI